MSERKIKLWLLLFFSALFALTASGHYGGDGMFHYATTEALVLDHDVWIGKHPHQWPAEFSSGLPAANAPAVSKYEIGMSLAELPLYIAGDGFSYLFKSVPHDYIIMLCVSFTNVLISAFALIIFFGILRQLNIPLRSALLWTLVLGLATPVWTYSKVGFREPLLMLGLLLLIRALVNAQLNKTYDAATCMLAGFAAGLLIATKLSCLPIALLGLGFFKLTCFKNFRFTRAYWRSIATLTGAFLIWVLLIGWYNHARFGSFFNFGLGLDATGFQHPWWLGTLGMLDSVGKGIFWYAPLSVLGFILFPRFLRKQPWLASFCGLGFVGTLLLNALFAGWTGGHGWGPRYLIFALPLLWLSAVFGFNYGASLWHKLVLTLGISLGILIQLPSVLLNFSRYTNLVQWYNLGDDVYSPLLTPILGNWILLKSSLQTALTGHSSTWDILVVANHDFIFHDLRVLDLQGWDGLDLWWLNIQRLTLPAGIAVAAKLSVLLLLLVLLYVGWQLAAQYRKAS